MNKMSIKCVVVKLMIQFVETFYLYLMEDLLITLACVKKIQYVKFYDDNKDIPMKFPQKKTHKK